MLVSAIASLIFGSVMADVNGKTVVPIGDPNQVATVLIFVVDGCPIARKYTPEINRVAKRYANRKVATYLVFSEPGIQSPTVRAMTKEFGLTPRALISPQLAVKARVRSVPTAVLYDRAGRVWYHGRIDDRFPALGVQRDPRRKDLDIAISEFLSGRPVSVPKTSVIGCVLPSQ